MAYKLGSAIEHLRVPREQFRHWRRHLDPNPHRTLLNYQLMLAYKIIQLLVSEHYYKILDLKQYNTDEFFSWFEQAHSDQEIDDTVIEVNRREQSFTVKSIGQGYDEPPGSLFIDVIYLQQVDQALMQALRQ